MLLSDMLKGGQTLQGKAGPSAINANDLLLLNSLGQLNSVKVSDYAAVANSGAAAVAATTYSSYPNSSLFNKFVKLSDGSLVIADSWQTGNSGCEVWKYTNAGKFIRSVTLDGNSTAVASPQIAQLTNGNLVVMWAEVASPYNLYFAILDQYLNTVVSPTLVGVAGLNPGPNPYLSVLSTGGFVITYTKPAGLYLAIYTNAGGVTLAPTAMTGMPAQTLSSNSSGGTLKTAQLDNGNIVVALQDSYAGVLGYTILSNSGSVVKAYTVLSSSGPGSTLWTYPELDVLPGYFCVATGQSGSMAQAFIMNDAGTLQGSSFSSSAISSLQAKLTDDGTNFWYGYGGSANNAITKLPVTGSGFVTTPWNTGSGVTQLFWDAGILIVVQNATVFPSVPLPNSLVPQPASVNMAENGMMIPGGDHTLISVGSGAFAVNKYLDTAIVGVSQQTLAAGNAGTSITFSHGGGAGKNGYPINPILGTIGKGFDHTATNLVGNKGTMLGNCAALEGII